MEEEGTRGTDRKSEQIQDLFLQAKQTSSTITSGLILAHSRITVL